MRGKDKGRGHWVNGVERERRRNKPQHKKTKPHQMAWEKRRKVELGRIDRKEENSV